MSWEPLGREAPALRLQGRRHMGLVGSGYLLGELAGQINKKFRIHLFPMGYTYQLGQCQVLQEQAEIR